MYNNNNNNNSLYYTHLPYKLVYQNHGKFINYIINYKLNVKIIIYDSLCNHFNYNHYEYIKNIIITFCKQFIL